MKSEQDLKNIFGKHIKTHRERKRWTQEKLAEKAGVSKNTISDIEAGDKFARANTLVRLANVFQTEVYELLKPDFILPDRPAEIVASFSEAITEVVAELGSKYLKEYEKRVP